MATSTTPLARIEAVPGLLGRVFSSLRSGRDLGSATRTCKTWNEAASDEHLVVAITIEQVGTATQPAEVEVLWRPKEGEFKPISWLDGEQRRERYAAGTEPDLYLKTIQIPETARYIKLNYQAQTGGASSTISAELMHDIQDL